MTGAATAFLVAQGWGTAASVPLAGDASARSYHRLTRDDGARAVLMLAPVATPVDRAAVAAFRQVGAHLRGLGLSAPQEIAADPAQGLILMEDLGDATLARLFDTGAPEAETAYATSLELLPKLAAHPPQGLAAPDAASLAAMPDLTFDLLASEGATVAGLAQQVREGLAAALRPLCDEPPVFSLRDMHGENLIWLPDRAGAARLGLLDYQDAVLLPRGYDLASLVDDVRRDIPVEWRNDLIARFADAHGERSGMAQARIDLLSLQRNLRILGVFRRLARHLGKPGYARFLPRTRALIARAVGQPELADLAPPVHELLELCAHWEGRE